MNSTEPRFRAVSPLRWREWESGSVVYNCITGETHFLSPLASFALRFLERTPLSAADLGPRLQAELGRDGDERLKAQITSLMQNFDAMAMVEEC